MIRGSISNRRSLFFSLLAVAIIAVGYISLSWIMNSRAEARGESLSTMPNVQQLWGGFKEVFTPHYRSGEVWAKQDAIATGTRFGLGLLATIVGSISIGLISGCFRSIDAFFTPILVWIAKIPPTAALPVFFALLGADNTMFIGLAIFGTVTGLYMTSRNSVLNIPEQLIHKSYILGIDHTTAVTTIAARMSLPHIIEGIRLSIGPLMVYLIAAEALSADVGFGYTIRVQARINDMKVVYPYLLMLSMFGLFVDWIFVWLKRLLCSWAIEKQEK